MTDTKTVNVGDRFKDRHGPIRIMSIAEGYAMVRRPQGMPFAIYLKDLLRLPYERVETEIA